MKKLICTMIFIFCFGFTAQAKELTAKENVSPNKIWTVKFTSAFDKNTLDQVKVVDNYGNDIDIEKKIIDDKTITVEPVDGAWGRGVTYQLQTNNIKSFEGKLIKDPVTMTFKTEEINFTPSGSYILDEDYLYGHMGTITWHDGSIARQVNCYGVNIFDDNSGGITVAFYTDTWSTKNIMDSPTSGQSIKLQVETAYNYMKAKYPNKNINVGLFYREFLNKKIDGYSNLELVYDAATGKYKVMVLLGAVYPNGQEYILNGGN